MSKKGYGVPCPYCGEKFNTVAKTPPCDPDEDHVKRIRECGLCKEQWDTFEINVLPQLDRNIGISYEV